MRFRRSTLGGSRGPRAAFWRLVRFAQSDQNQPHRLFQVRQIPLHDAPDGLKIHFEVIVDQNVSRSRDRLPRDLRMLLLVSFIHTLGRLAENLEISKDRILKRPRSENNLPPLGGVVMYLPNAFKDVFNVCSL